MREAKLFWTGGWDSSFQLCQLLLTYDCIVTPYYMLDGNRNSVARELMAMNKMKNELFRKFPKTKELLRPTKYFNVEDIKHDDLIEESYSRVKSKVHIGDQYDWLARMCKEHNINDMHLSLEKAVEPTVNHFLYRVIDKMDSINVNGQEVFRIREEYQGTDAYNLIGNYYFPILTLTKFDMIRIVKEKGWEDIMSLTWFCFSPRKNGDPCGKCKPCQQRIKEGFFWKFPIHSRMITFTYQQFIWPLKSVIKRALQIGKQT